MRIAAGLAFSVDLLNWVWYPANPVIRNRPGGYEEQFASDPKVGQLEVEWVILWLLGGFEAN